MPPRPDPPVPPTLAARLTDDALCSCPECGADHRVNVTTPELDGDAMTPDPPVTPTLAERLSELIDAAFIVRHAVARTADHTAWFAGLGRLMAACDALDGRELSAPIPSTQPAGSSLVAALTPEPVTPPVARAGQDGGR